MVDSVNVAGDQDRSLFSRSTGNALIADPDLLNKVMASDHGDIRPCIGVNDCITRAAFARGLSLIDLRLICNEDGDYANPIEPSVQGGAKIARAIAAVVDCRDVRRTSTVIAGTAE